MSEEDVRVIMLIVNLCVGFVGVFLIILVTLTLRQMLKTKQNLVKTAEDLDKLVLQYQEANRKMDTMLAMMVVNNENLEWEQHQIH